MQALVLVGGAGTRLRPLTERVPKPALPLAGRPFIAYMLDWLGRHGVDDVVLACGFEPGALREAIGDEYEGQRITYVTEPEPRGTGGAIRFAADHLDERFLALNGDLLSDLDLTALVRGHEAAGAAATIALVRVDDATGYGLVRRDADGWVTDFAEKPDPAEAKAGGDINGGAYVLERALLDEIPPDGEVSIERDTFPALISGAERRLRGLTLDGYWLDIGTPERFLRASWDILEGRVESAVGEHPDAVLVDPKADVDARAKIGPRAVVGPGCSVGAGAEIRGSVLGEGCSVGAEARVTDAIIAPGAEVEPRAEVGREIVGASTG